MEEDKRNEVLANLDELQTRVERHGGGQTDSSGGPALDKVKELRSLVESEHQDAAESARGLEQHLLAWESEHPQLVALASRVARALEDLGL